MTPALIPFLLATIPVVAAAQSPDKSGYTLARPTPRELMRPMSTDRPDATESPYTVDAGHIQLEMSFFEFAREDDGPRTDTVAAPRLNLKLGLTNSADLQLILDPLVRERTQGEEAVGGARNLGVRLKLNLVGNDDGDFALGLMPYIVLPTGDEGLGSRHVEGGLIVPLAFELSPRLSLGLMAELDVIRNGADDGYDAEFVHTGTLSRGLIGDLSGFIEYIGAAPLGSGGDYRASFNTGLAWALSGDVQLDAGIAIGLTAAADDYAIYSGISLRF